MSKDWSPVDPIAELRFALAEVDQDAPSEAFRSRLLTNVVSQRTPGMPVRPADRISGVETLRRLAARLSRLFTELDADDWTQLTVRGLDVQGLVGHLIGVEIAFGATLHGDASAAEADHVQSTQPIALGQFGRPPIETVQEWASEIQQTIAAVEAEPDPDRLTRFHGFELGLDAFLVARSFELWTHDEDIRRATGRALLDPDAETLSRMTDLATALLPAGIARVAGADADISARLVLSGPGGGAWDIPLGGRGTARARPDRRCAAHVLVDAASFCRVAANRADLARSGAIVTHDVTVAETLFAGAAALALD